MTTPKADTTRAAILAAGLGLARSGLHMVTARRVAPLAGLHASNVIYYFKGNEALLDAVAAEAVVRGDVQIMARLIIEKHPAVASLPGADRDRVMLSASSALQA